MLVHLAKLVARALRELGLDRLERVGARLADLRAYVLRLGDIEVIGRLCIPQTELVERRPAVAKPFARDEDRAAHVEAKHAVLERRRVPLPHQEPNQAFVAVVQLRLVADDATGWPLQPFEVRRPPLREAL